MLAIHCVHIPIKFVVVWIHSLLILYFMEHSSFAL